MDGDTPLEKKLNALLTRSFILNRDVPADECLFEAKEILDMFANKTTEEDLAKYLHHRFGFEDDDHAPFVAVSKKVVEIIEAPE
jgi:hypothetical protein